jgi:hypothetical protein
MLHYFVSERTSYVVPSVSLATYNAGASCVACCVARDSEVASGSFYSQFQKHHTSPIKMTSACEQKFLQNSSCLKINKYTHC